MCIDIIYTKKCTLLLSSPQCKAIVASDAVPIDKSKSLYEFFTLHSHIFLRGSKNNLITELDINIEDKLRSYEQGIDNKHITKPNDNNIRFFKVTSPGLNLPGIQVQSTATIAVEISKSSTTIGYPCMEITVISDKTSIKGGLFNKIANNNSPTDNKTATTSLHKINVVPKENHVVFESQASLSLSIDLPSILSAKHIIERSGSSSIQKMLENDLSVSLTTFHQEYVRWLEGSTSTSNGSLTMKRLKSRSRRPQVVKRWFKKIIYSWFI